MEELSLEELLAQGAKPAPEEELSLEELTAKGAKPVQPSPTPAAVAEPSILERAKAWLSEKTAGSPSTQQLLGLGPRQAAPESAPSPAGKPAPALGALVAGGAQSILGPWSDEVLGGAMSLMNHGSYEDNRQRVAEILARTDASRPVLSGIGKGAGALMTGKVLPASPGVSAAYGAGMGAGAGETLEERAKNALISGAGGAAFGTAAKAHPKAALPVGVGLGVATAADSDLPASDRIAAGFATIPSAASLAVGLPALGLHNNRIGQRDQLVKEALVPAAARQSRASAEVEGVFDKRLTLDAKREQALAEAAEWKAYQKKTAGAGDAPKRSLRGDIAAIHGDMGNRAQAMQQVAQTTDALKLDVPGDVREGLLVAGKNHLKNKTPEALTFAKGMGEVKRTSAESVLARRKAEFEAALKERVAKASKPVGKTKRLTPADDALYTEKRKALDRKMTEHGDELVSATEANSPEGVLAEGKKQAAQRKNSTAFGVVKNLAKGAVGGPLGKFSAVADQMSRLERDVSPEVKAYLLDKRAGRSRDERLEGFNKSTSTLAKYITQLLKEEDDDGR